ncbi:5-dehydro-4-deoxy-D-glucuronate isomerase [Pontibacter sp. G13]|uniref:5-dehydro-4-deoxy-D-glucuronate isomerase n=1 Tax=Pontibacter sp. G13 TaxID=3074898 RepID=UPI002889C43A|nr:5-dehydro-4-deoxy-D-glucuronate isomerase [Pontibacter sp. G13]WNJ18637.1 5-dehydro-4-deoxy-D-glucuronate isomerase [Pontibacter sp. G13]
MNIKFAVHPNDFQQYGTDRLREEFHAPSGFESGKISLTYTHYDRFVFGYIQPTTESLSLPSYPELQSDFFHQRRESGILNVGGTAEVTVDGTAYSLENGNILYIGRGAESVSFQSADEASPALLYLNSAPAHAAHPTTLGLKAEANRVELGTPETANERVLFQFIHENGIKSCQLVMGYTEMISGSVWNTFPPHTHDRRMEVYMYFDLPEDHLVMHFMGPGNNTRNLVMRNHEAAISPPWSIHAGAGTIAYKFAWGMAGENQAFTDMDGIPLTDIY